MGRIRVGRGMHIHVLIEELAKKQYNSKHFIVIGPICKDIFNRDSRIPYALLGKPVCDMLSLLEADGGR